MFGLEQLPRTLAAARRDLAHRRRHVRLSVVNDLVRLSQPDRAERGEALTLLGKLVADDSDPEVQARAAIGLADGEAGQEQIAVLLTAARSEHVGVAEMALAALREISPAGEPRVTRLVASLARSEHGALRFQAVGAAARLLDEPAFLGIFEAALADADAKVRGHALRVASERFGDELPSGVRRQARPALADQERWVRLAAAILLAPCGEEGASSVLVDAVNQGWKVPAPEDEQVIIELVGELELSDALPGLRRHARGWLGIVPGRFAWQAQVAMARLGDEGARRAITAGLGSRQFHVRAASALAVGRARLHGLRANVEALAREGKLEPEVLERVLEDLADG